MTVMARKNMRIIPIMILSQLISIRFRLLIFFLIGTVGWIYCMKFTITTSTMFSSSYHYSNTNGTSDSQSLQRTSNKMDFGVLLFAYSHDETLCFKFLHETHSLCHDLYLKHSNQSYHLNISLFTVQKYYIQYVTTYSPATKCAFDHIIFVDNLVQLTKSNREFTTRIKLLLHSPYSVTMTLDSDMYPCYPLDVVSLYTQMITKDIDFAYTSHERANVPQGGLFVYRINNKTRYLFHEWYKYHRQQYRQKGQKNDQLTLNRTIPGFGLGMHKQRYVNDKRLNQLLYPNNKIIMFHRRIYSSYYYDSPDSICQVLNKYSNALTMAYVNYTNNNVYNCFGDKEPKCFDHFKKYRTFTEELYSNTYPFLWSDEYQCQWNETVVFVAYYQHTCGYW
eukprot:106_1